MCLSSPFSCRSRTWCRYRWRGGERRQRREPALRQDGIEDVDKDEDENGDEKVIKDKKARPEVLVGQFSSLGEEKTSSLVPGQFTASTLKSVTAMIMITMMVIMTKMVTMNSRMYAFPHEIFHLSRIPNIRPWRLSQPHLISSPLSHASFQFQRQLGHKASNYHVGKRPW